MKRVKAALLGDPVSHSLSPRLFERIGRRLKTAVAYDAIRVGTGDLDCAVAFLRRGKYAGFNVTIPLKESVIGRLDALTPEARAIGAVNAVRLGRRAVGHNTDAAGFRDALLETGFSPAKRPALVFGAGGAARAVGYALGLCGVSRVRFCARSAPRARQTVRDLGKAFPKTRFSAGQAVAAPLWVNATPLGMKGFPRRSPAPKGLGGCELAFDLVYGRKTPFLKQARASGSKTVDGLSMLAYQALRAWEFWFKPLPAPRRRALKTAIIRGLP